MDLCMPVSPKHRNPKSFANPPPPPCPLFVPVSPGTFFQPPPVPCAAGRREAACPLAPSDPVSRCQFSFILERLIILETSFPPSNGAESGRGFKRDPRGPRRHERPCPGRAGCLWKGTAWVKKGKDVSEITVGTRS